MNIPQKRVTLDVFHADKSPLKDVQPENIAHMFSTLEVSHPEISPLNDVAVRVREGMSEV